MATKTILVVDDEPGIVTVVCDYLDRAGFRVLTAGDGPTALRLARAERPSLLVLDLMLPGMDGLDITRAQLVDLVYDTSYAGYDRTVDAHIKNLRRKIESDPHTPRYILTVYSIGYKFAEDVAEDAPVAPDGYGGSA
jgi:DNA-binding response OmpR family regulator